jgi:hypothetical protein
MADSEKTLDIILKYGLDSSALQQTTAGVNSTTTALANQEQQLRRNRTELRELGQVFTAIGLAGAAIYVPAIAASQEYLKSAEQNEALSRQWLADTDKIKQSTIDIGRVVTEGLLPGYNDIAGIARSGANFAQQNPGVIQAAVTIGGALVAIGAGGKIFVEVSRAVTDIQLIVNGGMLAAAKIQAGAASTMLAAANIQAGGAAAGDVGEAAVVGAGGTAGLAGLAAAGTAAILPIAAVTAGVVILANAAKQVDAHSQAFANIDNFINGLIDPTHPKVGPNTSSATTGANNSGALPNVENTEAIRYYANLNQPKAPDMGALTQAQINTQGLADYKSEQDALAAAQKTYDTDSIAENKRYYDTQASELAAHNLTDLQDEQDFETQKAQKIRDFNQSELDQLQTYQNSMADLSQSHQDRLRDLTKNHDVLGIESENTSYSEQKAQKERDFNEADQARRTAFSQQQSDEQKNYDLSKKRRDDAFDLQQKQEADQHTAAMQTLKQNLADQRQLEINAFQSQMNALLGISNVTQAALIKGFDQFMSEMGYSGYGQTPPGGGSKNPVSQPQAAGGYAYPGHYYQRGEQGVEYVMDAPTTKYAQSIVGGRLTQQNLIAAMISGRSGGASSSIYQDSRSVNVSGLTAQDRLVVRDLVNRGVSDWAKAEFGR